MTGGVGTHGLRAATDYLDGEGVAYAVVEHAHSDTALGEARASHVDAARTAKTVLVRGVAGTWFVVVVPADHHASLIKLRKLLGLEDPPRLATETEIAGAFPQMHVGAIPPFGPVLVNAAVVDARLLEHDEVLCAGGDHRHAIRIDPREIVRLADARVADVCQDL